MLTYSHFFGHLSALLMGCDFQQLRLGSDDEHAMCNATKHFFARVRFLTCSRHLKENSARTIDESVVCASQERRVLMDALFGADGLIACNDTVLFDECTAKIQTNNLTRVLAAFSEYVIPRVFPLMRQNVLSGNSRGMNNNCESINHVL